MTTLLNFVLQSVLCSIVLYGVWYLLLRQETCHRFNRFYLLISALCSFAFPLIKINSPLSLTQDFIPAIELPELALGETIANGSSMFSGFSWMWLIYIGGAAFFLLRFGLRLYSLRTLIRSGEKEVVLDYVLIPTGGKLPTFSFWRYLFWDDSQQLAENERQQILRHELAHIRKKHSADLLLIELLHAILWFNPFMTFLKKALMITHEFEADQSAIDGAPTGLYQQLLARQVLSQQGVLLGSAFNQSNTLLRLRMLANKNSSVFFGKLILPVLMLLLMFGAISCQHGSWDEETVAPKQESMSNETATSDSEKIYNLVDERPEPVGGIPVFYNYIATNLNYPAQARRMGIQGKVFVEFVVDNDGSVTRVKVLKGIGAGCDAEAMRVVASSPKWTPGYLDGKAVKVRLILPITFKLDGEEVSLKTNNKDLTIESPLAI